MTLIDLSLLPAPPVVEPLDYEAILAQIKATFLSLIPADEQAAVSAVLDLESEPVVKLMELVAYRELVLRSRVNEAARSTMLAWARGEDLDNLAALYNCNRLTITPADTTTIPPTPAVMESDTDFRRRIQLAPEGLSVAGSRGAYLFHTLSADGDVLDADISNPVPGTVRVAVLSRTGDGTAGVDLLNTVAAALSAETVRPLCDTVLVEGATIVPYTITATINVLPGPSPMAVMDAASAALAATVAQLHNCGRDVTRSALFAALHQPGAYRVDLTEPADDIAIASDEAAYCTAIALTLGTIGE
jgi:phage-related baseplate assembly protein